MRLRRSNCIRGTTVNLAGRLVADPAELLTTTE
jgi:hypothetical protein